MIKQLSTYLTRECSNPTCRFRFPAPDRQEIGVLCPKCKTETKVKHKIKLAPDHLDTTALCSQTKFHLEMVLDNIRSTFNVGAMFRTADGAGVKKIHLTGISPLPDHVKVKKTALGAENVIPYAYHNNCLEAVKILKAQGYKIIALEKTSQSIPIESTTLLEYQPTALVVGNEVAGVDPDILDIADTHVHIPMNGIKGSLNVAIAYGIAVYHYLLKSEEENVNANL